MSAWPHGDPDALVRTVLAAPGYRTAPAVTDVAPPPSFWSTFVAWIARHVLGPLLRPFARAIASTHGVGTAVGLALALLALAAIAFAVYRLALAFVAPALASDPMRSAGIEPYGDAADWRARARDAADRGDYAAAIAALFRAALAALDERAIVRYDAARTPAEYRRLVRRERGPAAPAFDELAERFTRAVYAPRASGADDFAAAERAYAAFEPALA
jgi:hypothetical protein